MKKSLIAAIILLSAAIAIVAFWQFRSPPTIVEPPPVAVQEAQGAKALKRVVINEAARTLLYLPLYHAVEKGYFRDNGLEVEVVTGGTATNSFAAMVSGEADFSQADPMYVPISREKAARTKVVAQVVGRIGIWAVTNDPQINDMSRSSIQGKRISTHPRPMTTYTYTTKAIHDAGLEPDKDVEIIQSTPGTELTPLLAGKADFAVTVEPNISKAEKEGAHVVLSFARLLGDQILTALMTREEYISQNHDTVQAVVNAYQRALEDIQKNPQSAIASAQDYFPQVDAEIISAAVRRMVADEVFPRTVLVSEESWDKAVAVRVAAGDLKAPSSREENCALEIMETAARSVD